MASLSGPNHDEHGPVRAGRQLGATNDLASELRAKAQQLEKELMDIDLCTKATT